MSEPREPRLRTGEGISLIEYIKELHQINQELIKKLDDHLDKLESRVRGVEKVMWTAIGVWTAVELIIHFLK